MPAYGFYCRHVEGLVFRNVTLRTQQADLRPAMVFDDVTRVQVHSLDVGYTPGALAVLRLVNVEEAEISNFKAPTDAKPAFLLEGDRTRKISLPEL